MSSNFFGPEHALPGAADAAFWKACPIEGESCPQWWHVEFPEPKIVSRLQFQVISPSTIPLYFGTEVIDIDGSPADFSLDASHDGTNWETVMEKTDQEGAAANIKTYELSNKNAFSFFRIYIKRALCDNDPTLQCLALYEGFF
jgi:hypothetical protein